MGQSKFVLWAETDFIVVYCTDGEDLTKGTVVRELPEDIELNPADYNAKISGGGYSCKVAMYTLINTPRYDCTRNISLYAYPNGNVRKPTDAHVLVDDNKNCLCWDGNLGRDNIVVFYDKKRADLFKERHINSLSSISYLELIDKNIEHMKDHKLLQNGTFTPITLDETSIIDIAGEVVINTFESPGIVVNPGCKWITIRGVDKHSKLKIKGSLLQPCIGLKTNTGLSYGRYEINHNSVFFGLVLDNITVELEPTVPYFSIGKYGTNEMPIIIKQNGAKLICPEEEGIRFLKKEVKPPTGSTKISELAIYETFLGSQEEFDKSVNADCKVNINKLPERFRCLPNMETPIKNFVKAVELSKMIDNLDLTSLLIGKDIHRATTITVLRNNSIFSAREINIEVDKIEYFFNKFVNGELNSSDESVKYNAPMISHIMSLLENGAMTKYLECNRDNRIKYVMYFMYELISSYSFDGWDVNDMAKSINQYINENTKDIVEFNKTGFSYYTDRLLNYIFGIDDSNTEEYQSYESDILQSALSSMSGGLGAIL